MKKNTRTFSVVALLAAALFTVNACNVKRNTVVDHIPQNNYYESNTPKEECCLCGNGKGTLIPAYRGQDNIAIISLNTFQLSYIELNRYDDHGRPIHKKATYSTQIHSTGEGGFSTHLSEDSNRGYATGTISLNTETLLDLEKAASFLCSNCLNYILEQSWSGTNYGVGVIDFKNQSIQLFEENMSAFIFGDYYISCEAKNWDEDNKYIDFMAFYCPPRYD